MQRHAQTKAGADPLVERGTDRTPSAASPPERRRVLRELGLLATLRGQRAAESARAGIERVAVGGALLVITGMLAAAACLLLLVGLSAAIAVLFDWPPWAAQLLVGGGLLLGAALALVIGRRAGRRARLDRYRACYGEVPPAGGSPADYLAGVERRVRGDARRSALHALSASARPSRLAMIGGAGFALGLLLRRSPLLAATAAAAAGRCLGRAALRAPLRLLRGRRVP
jgi:hypothetical protein